MVARTKFSSQVSPEVLTRMREIAKADGRDFQSVLEDAMTAYIVNHEPKNVRTEVMEHFRKSMERNQRLGELLAQ